MSVARPKFRRCRAAVGLTLVETVAAMAISSVLLLALTSAMTVAARAVPDGRGLDVKLTTAAGVLEQLAEELATASTVSERTATAITFSLPDRTGDGVEESVRYAWSGQASAPVTRRCNNTDAELLADVTHFALAYTVRSATVNGVTASALTAVRVQVRVGPGKEHILETTVPLLNTPQAPTP